MTGISSTTTMPTVITVEHLCAYSVRVEWTPAEIKRRRGAKGMSQQDLADALEVSRRAVTNWETGRAEPRGRYLQALDKVLGETTATPGVSLTSATNMEILAELARRFAAYEAAEHRAPDQSIGDWRWSKEDAPSARRHPEDDVSNGSAVDQGQ